MLKSPELPNFESAKFLTRFFLRLVILAVFAALGKQGFANTLQIMLFFAIAYCIFAAVIRREQPFGPDLIQTHPDDMLDLFALRFVGAQVTD